MDGWALAVSTAVAGLTWTGIAYPAFSVQAGLKRGAWVGSDGWSAYFLTAALSTIFSAWSAVGFFGALVAVAVGMPFAFLLTKVFRSWAQIVALLSLPASIAWAALS